ncbi:MAG: hypothetical protein EA385_13095 [Salinarimonadaceae bacterium]|nr:MAG: hypothetical protein EA385_13095 [Salinarimonadaceae bacterium]
MKERSPGEVEYSRYLHFIAVISVALYAWQIHSFWVGIAVWILLYFGISLSNLLIIMVSIKKDATEPFRWIRFNRWAWIICAFLAIGVSGASLETT